MNAEPFNTWILGGLDMTGIKGKAGRSGIKAKNIPLTGKGSRPAPGSVIDHKPSNPERESYPTYDMCHNRIKNGPTNPISSVNE